LLRARQLENPGNLTVQSMLTKGVGVVREAARVRDAVDAAVSEASMLCEHAYDDLSCCFILTACPV